MAEEKGISRREIKPFPHWQVDTKHLRDILEIYPLIKRGEITPDNGSEFIGLERSNIETGLTPREVVFSKTQIKDNQFFRLAPIGLDDLAMFSKDLIPRDDVPEHHKPSEKPQRRCFSQFLVSDYRSAIPNFFRQILAPLFAFTAIEGYSDRPELFETLTDSR